MKDRALPIATLAALFVGLGGRRVRRHYRSGIKGAGIKLAAPQAF